MPALSLLDRLGRTDRPARPQGSPVPAGATGGVGPGRHPGRQHVRRRRPAPRGLAGRPSRRRVGPHRPRRQDRPRQPRRGHAGWHVAGKLAVPAERGAAPPAAVYPGVATGRAAVATSPGGPGEQGVPHLGRPHRTAGEAVPSASTGLSHSDDYASTQLGISSPGISGEGWQFSPFGLSSLRPGVFVRLVPATVFKTVGGFE